MLRPTYDLETSEMSFEFNGQRHSFTVTEDKKSKPIGELLKEQVHKLEMEQKANMEVKLMNGSIELVVNEAIGGTIFGRKKIKQ